MISRLKLACVEYYNTLPFLHGLSLLDSRSTDVELLLGPPSLCSQHFVDGTADIALIPVGALDRVDDYRLLDSYCIGCDGEVDTVAILSQVPIQSVSELHLDPQSNTSNRLVQILCHEYWQIFPQYVSQSNDYNQESILAIGDKVFDLESNYQYKYDLGAAWKAHTGLPFVFAVWIARDTVSTQVTDEIDIAFGKGMDQPELWIPDHLQHQSTQLMTYLTQNIVFTFDDSLREALNLFLQKLETHQHGHSRYPSQG